MVFSTEMKPSHTLDEVDGLVRKEPWPDFGRPDCPWVAWLTLKSISFCLAQSVFSLPWCLRGYWYWVFKVCSAGVSVENTLTRQHVKSALFAFYQEALV